MKPVVALVTDFGSSDWYVGVMKGIIKGLNPDVSLIDITHEITPHHIAEAAFVLASSYRHFPPGTVFLVVVDPGVGTRRRALAVKAGDWFFVGPDNGAFTAVMERESDVTCVEVTQMRPPESSTFHGRDVFAPIAARLSLNTPLRKLGPKIRDPVTLALPKARLTSPGEIIGEVLYIDRFGNIITNIPEQPVRSPSGRLFVSVCSLPSRRVSVSRACRHYAELVSGEPGILIGSTGYMEIAVFEGSAARMLGVEIGDLVHVMLTRTRARQERRKP